MNDGSQIQAPDDAAVEDDAAVKDEPVKKEPVKDQPEHVAFEHAFFKTAKDGYFRIPDDGEEAVYVFDLDGVEALLPLPGIKREFELTEDDPDGRMLDLLQEALAFVSVLKVGDPLPREVLTGEASWEISQAHRDIAYSRLTLQMTTWLSGDELMLNDPEQLVRIAQDPSTREKVNEAFKEAAEQLGFGDDEGSREKVVQLIEYLAEELAHIEALREKFGLVKMMEEKIKELRDIYVNEQSMLEILTPVSQLIDAAVQEYKNKFDQLDAQTGEIMAVLKNIDRQIGFIREMRNDLYRRMVAWDDMFDRWDKAMVKRSKNSEDLLRDTYRFLAPRFMKSDEWVLMSKLQDEKSKNSTEMKW